MDIIKAIEGYFAGNDDPVVDTKVKVPRFVRSPKGTPFRHVTRDGRFHATKGPRRICKARR